MFRNFYAITSFCLVKAESYALVTNEFIFQCDIIGVKDKMVETSGPIVPTKKKGNGKGIQAKKDWTNDVDDFFRYLRSIRKQSVPAQIGVGAAGGV